MDRGIGSVERHIDGGSSMKNITNCPKCGRIFVKALRPVCEQCAKEYEEMFDKVYKYIRKKENRQASLQDVIEATGVPEEYIFQFIREGRLRLSQFPNLAVPCESCGRLTRDGRLCAVCRGDIQRDLKMIEQEKEIAKRIKEEEKRVQTYKTMDERLKR